MTSRLLVSLEDVSLGFGQKRLFEALNLHITEGDKICLLGKNGAGKTTLMRLITGHLEMDSGKRFILPGLRVGYLAQQVETLPGQSVRDFVMQGLPKDERTEEKQHLADIVMGPLELEPENDMAILSGGQLRRAALAQALVAEPDLLLLDEPTNHLDLSGIEWLEGFLNTYRGALIVVSHDRTFLANISRRVFWIDRGFVHICPTGYAGFEEWQEKIVEQEARELQNMQKKLAAEVDWTQGGVTGRRKRNQRRMRELHRLRDKLRADKAAYRQRMKSIELDPLEAVPASKKTAEFRHISKRFTQDGKPVSILDDFSMTIMKGDRIGVLGRNGSGKSTFLRLLVGELEQDSGTIFRSKTLDVSYFDQNRQALDPEKTLWQTLVPDGGSHVKLGQGENAKMVHVCGYLKSFLFDPREARQPVGILSGGQQNRLLLARVLAQPGNLLILDEPTNDLDMDTLDMLQEILSDYPGTLIVVSHDRDFLDRTVTQVLAFEGDAKVEGHIGGYSDYLAAKRTPHPTSPRKRGEEIMKTSSSTPLPPQAGGGREGGQPRGKMTFKLKHELENLPARIANLEAELAALQKTLADPSLYTRDPDGFDRASSRLARARAELESAEHRWLELDAMRESLESA